MDRSTMRESGSSDSNRPAPTGDFDGYTRRQAMRDLLAKHEEPSDPTEHVPAHRFWARRAARVLKLALVAFAINIVWGTGPAFACTITANAKGEITKSADCTQQRLTPAQAADIIRPNQYVAPPVCTDCDGPRVSVAPYTGERWQHDFLRADEFKARSKMLENLGNFGVPYAPFGFYQPPVIVAPVLPHVPRKR